MGNGVITPVGNEVVTPNPLIPQIFKILCVMGNEVVTRVV